MRIYESVVVKNSNHSIHYDFSHPREKHRFVNSYQFVICILYFLIIFISPFKATLIIEDGFALLVSS